MPYRDRDTENESVKIRSEEYFVYAPSDSFIKSTGVTLRLAFWERQSYWDEREVMDGCAPVIPDKTLVQKPELAEVYGMALLIVNQGRKSEYPALREEFCRFEDRLATLDKFVLLGAPEDVSNDVLTLVRSQIVKINLLSDI